MIWDIILILIILALIAGAAYKIIKEKKKGNKCIGCPYSSNCSKKNE